MAGTTSSRFFWSDWLSDPELRSCSATARSVWMDMLCLASGASERGFVMVGENPATPEQIARIVGEPFEVVKACISELENNAVFSRDRRGIIYSRRMVRDGKRGAASAKGGKKGGPATLGSKKGIFATREPTPDSSYTIHNTHSTTPVDAEAISEGRKRDGNNLAKLSKLLGLDIVTNYVKVQQYTRQLSMLEERGIDIAGDLIPCIEQMKADGRLPPVGSLMYFERPTQDFRRAREVSGAAQAEIAAEQQAEVAKMSNEEWKPVCERWLFLGVWAPKYGPKPHEAGTRVPKCGLPEILDIFEKCGRKPYARREGVYVVPYDWPERAEWPKRCLDQTDLCRFVRAGEDFRVVELPENVVPLRKAL